MSICMRLKQWVKKFILAKIFFLQSSCRHATLHSDQRIPWWRISDDWIFALKINVQVCILLLKNESSANMESLMLSCCPRRPGILPVIPIDLQPQVMWWSLDNQWLYVVVNGATETNEDLWQLSCDCCLFHYFTSRCCDRCHCSPDSYQYIDALFCEIKSMGCCDHVFIYYDHWNWQAFLTGNCLTISASAKYF